jgi:hypothetical protein
MTDLADITDAEVAGVVDEALRTIVLLRARVAETNAYRELDAVATLVRHARSRLPELVADARDEANSWLEVAAALCMSRPRAIATYVLHARNRRQPLELD